MKLKFYLEPLKPQKKSYGTRISRRDFSTEELADYLQDNEIRSTGDLKKIRVDDEPTVYDYQKHFGSWSEAIEFTYGVDAMESLLAIELNHEYFIKVMLAFKIQRYEDYCNARNRRPDIVPSLRQARKLFGTFSALKQASKLYSMEASLDSLLELSEELGRIPKLSDCKKAGVRIDSLIKYFKTYKALKKFIQRLRRQKQVS